ncbi:MAG: cupin domain-containing protein [Proteobacteria bacterium]|nr:cupin domain-containing protein [Pseudomonadota bacterium]
MQVFNIKDIAKFDNENLNAAYSEVAPGGYVKHRVINNEKCCLTIACFRDGQGPPEGAGLHAHPGADEVYYIVEGEALSVDNDGNEKRLHAGQFAYFEAGEPHNTCAAPGKDMIAYRFQIGEDRQTVRSATSDKASTARVFDIAEVGKFSDENPDAPYSEIAPGGYVRHRVILNDKCAVTVLCMRAGQGPVKESGLHHHPGADEVYFIVKGEAINTDAEGNESRMGPNQFVYFDAGYPHNTRAADGSDLLVYRVTIGKERKSVRPDWKK